MLTFRDSNKSFELDGGPLKDMTNCKFSADQSTPQDRNLIYEFGKEKKFDTKNIGRPNTRDSSVIGILKSPAIIASGNSRTVFSSSDPNELCDRLKLLLEEKHAGNNSDIINQGIVVIVDKILEYKY